MDGKTIEMELSRIFHPSSAVKIIKFLSQHWSRMQFAQIAPSADFQLVYRKTKKKRWEISYRRKIMMQNDAARYP